MCTYTCSTWVHIHAMYLNIVGHTRVLFHSPLARPARVRWSGSSAPCVPQDDEAFDQYYPSQFAEMKRGARRCSPSSIPRVSLHAAPECQSFVAHIATSLAKECMVRCNSFEQVGMQTAACRGFTCRSTGLHWTSSSANTPVQVANATRL